MTTLLFGSETPIVLFRRLTDRKRIQSTPLGCFFWTRDSRAWHRKQSTNTVRRGSRPTLKLSPFPARVSRFPVRDRRAEYSSDHCQFAFHRKRLKEAAGDSMKESEKDGGGIFKWSAMASSCTQPCRTSRRLEMRDAAARVTSVQRCG